jgi:GDP-4-dehydro-6-deoxy-D-mannose reductase
VRALVTGGNGFVGRYLCDELRGRGLNVVSAARSIDGPGIDFALDLADAENVRGVVQTARCDVLFHLAAQAFVPESTRAPLETYDINVMGTGRLIDALRTLPRTLRPRLIFVSSSEVYGAHPASDLPLFETAMPMPATPYAASKLAAEAIVLGSVRAYGLSALVTRGFNHIGPGQSDRFVVPAFAKRLAAIAAGGNPLFPVGNLTPVRDFLDVRDVVRAYADLAERGVDGETYNVCSGKPTRIQDVLRTLINFARVGVEIREDPTLVRPVDVPAIYGDYGKLEAATGWRPAISLARSLRDVYEDARTGAPAP